MFCEWCGKQSKREGLCKECYFKVKCLVPTVRVKNVYQLMCAVDEIENKNPPKYIPYRGIWKEIECALTDYLVKS
jgi:hypothetical protein